MGSRRVAIHLMKPYAAMIFLQFGYAGLIILSVDLLKQGMSHYLLVVYRNVAATIFVAPFAAWFERKVRPKMTLSSFLKIMVLALLESVLDQNLYYMGVKLTSGSYGASLLNMLPAITFLLAVLLRIEKANLRCRRSQAKMAGTLITVVGVLVMIIYHGRTMEIAWTKGRRDHKDTHKGNDECEFLKGTLMLVSACFCWSSFFILQDYPAELSLSTLICAMGVIESVVVTLAMGSRKTRSWAIGWDMRLLTVVYSGVMCSGVAYYLQGMVMKKRGPVFATAFNPLCMIAVAFIGSFVLDEEITLGRIIGAVIIVIGLYALMWGKSKEYQISSQNLSAATVPEAIETSKKEVFADASSISISTN